MHAPIARRDAAHGQATPARATMNATARPPRRALTASPPSILLMMADDWGFGDLSSRGHSWLRTPNLDRLRSEGTDF